MMKDEKKIRYEKPTMSAYDFRCAVVGDSQGGDIEEGCSEPGWDDEE
ncbi:MAG: hypothetical protein IJJ28_03330 [Lentisphaeria bacterium]|nr:hypothetical protein [Lentisphaeria bacterium]